MVGVHAAWSNGGVSDEIEQRLAAAVQAVYEFEITVRRCSDLSGRRDELLAELAVLRAQDADEQKDVERLEGLSLARVLASLKGAR